MHRRLSEIATYVDAQRSALLAAAHELPEAAWPTRPAPDQWSVSDVCEHLHRVERGSARLITMRVMEARAGGHALETDDSSVMECLDFASLTDRSRRLEAPSRVAPEGGWTRAASLTALAGSRSELHAAIADADGLALQGVRHAHPRLGDIDLYQWLLFVGQHEARHVLQVTEIVQTLSGAAAQPRPANVEIA